MIRWLAIKGSKLSPYMDIEIRLPELNELFNFWNSEWEIIDFPNAFRMYILSPSCSESLFQICTITLCILKLIALSNIKVPDRILAMKKQQFYYCYI